MANEFERIDAFEKEMKEIDYYITGHTSFLYDRIEDPTIQEIVECTRAIAINNFLYITTKREQNAKIQETITGAKVIESTTTLIQEEQTVKQTTKRAKKDLSEIIELIIYSCLSDELPKILEGISQDDLKQIKLSIYKMILETKQKIKLSILTNPTNDISKLQDLLNAYEIALEALKEYEKESIKEQEETTEEHSNIVIAPNKKTTYLYKDITEYPERIKEIKLIFEKIVDGYFLKTKDTKQIEGYSEKLYEYKHPNGIRVLYIVQGSIIIICSLFMKDKQKSTRIANEYEEAISRFYESEQYILENFSNPDFHIEQAELVGEIFTLLDGITLTKKVGE